ncbi:MAG TPA: imidazolonepropionase [Mycobacteriales bacterium]|jgi:imidazolonepropionase|nr:imidazolonepropionase [Mycobacteriales bacterium]
MHAASLVVRHIGRLTTWATPRIVDAAIAIVDGRVAWVGADRELPVVFHGGPELDAAGAAVIPGFVDCHTHAVWAGNRRPDFVGRLEGSDYSPGGIAATVAATRRTGDDELLQLTRKRIAAMAAGGTTTVEVKSGYGLSVEAECRLLEVIGRAAGVEPVRIEATYLGAHVVPDGRSRSGYVDEVVATLPDASRRGAKWCDVFCDEGAFTVEEARQILNAAKVVGLGLRIHADQLTHNGGARLAAELGCASADHLDHVDAPDAAALAAAGVVGVLVPVASLYSGSQRWSHAATLREAGVTLAIATDCNPGTAWCESMPYAVQLACLGMGLSVEHALWAATVGGAQALRLPDRGQLGVGARGDLLVLAADHEVDLVAHLGAPAVVTTVIGGRVVGESP